MVRKFKWIIYTKAFSAVIYYFLMAYLSTLRLKVINLDHLNKLLEDGETVILCSWHQQFFAAIRNFRGFSKYNPAIMISRSRDGELISRIANRVGWQTARGSSSKGGRSAMSAMISHLKTHKLAAHILDGPQGPIGKAKPGAIKMAHKSGAVIVPFYVTASKAWFFKSWDQFMLPKPFSRVNLFYGESIRFEPCNSSEELEKQRQQLENTMKDWLILKYPV